jgi:uncharacterized protein YcbX
MPDVIVGSVSSIARYPVKSMLGEVLSAVEVLASGLAGDRAYALVDDETGKVVSVKRPRRWGRIFELTAATEPGGSVAVRFPDGSRCAIDDAGLPGKLGALFGRPVSVATEPPADASFDELWVRDLKEGVEPYFGAGSRTEDGEELVDGGGFMSALGSFSNFGAVHLVTTGTMRALAELAPGSSFDPARFRPNIVVDTSDEGFVETAWQGRELCIGGARLAVSFTVPRCVMTTLPQGDLPADPDVLRTITKHNAVDTLGTGVPYPCVGVYADVVTPGTVTAGDPVRLV